jgi:hypothetical protein
VAHARFEVFTEVTMFWHVAGGNPIDRYGRFGGTYCLYLKSGKVQVVFWLLLSFYPYKWCLNILFLQRRPGWLGNTWHGGYSPKKWKVRAANNTSQSGSHVSQWFKLHFSPFRMNKMFLNPQIPEIILQKTKLAYLHTQNILVGNPHRENST